jgi:hypothetical protein
MEREGRENDRVQRPTSLLDGQWRCDIKKEGEKGNRRILEGKGARGLWLLIGANGWKVGAEKAGRRGGDPVGAGSNRGRKQGGAG